jgi:hypothetical protein
VQYLVNACLAKSSVNEISANQRAGLAGRVLEKITRDIPDLKNIKHIGWQVIAKALCFKLKDEQNADKWRRLIVEAEAVPNTSDSLMDVTELQAVWMDRQSAHGAPYRPERATQRQHQNAPRQFLLMSGVPWISNCYLINIFSRS